ncbi:MAG: glutamine synthetase beta-grasp domain-containing protein [Candidatus Aminicenantes bacterium]|nr:glutamine synthetase beta-grasp domain-containing protein [Candidatus Aminicenantes bacterium]
MLSNMQRKLMDLQVEFIDLKTLDLKGKLHSLMLPSSMLDEKLYSCGVGFDASSYGFAKPEKSDMVLIPDLETMAIDPFRERKTAIFMANIHLTDPARTRFSEDPRFIAFKAETALSSSKIGSRALFGPEFEFFIFKEADYGVFEDGNFYFLKKDSEAKSNQYHAGSPDDEHIDFKNEAASMMQRLGIEIKYHHHEVAMNQHEIETRFNPLLQTADQAVLIKYVLFNLAKKHNLFVTFMPKPFFGKAGNGWHVHQFIVGRGGNAFFKKGNYGNLSDIGLHYLSGLLFHSGSLSAFANASTNSYKRLVRGFEAPVSAIFATSNRNAAIRIPSYVEENETRLEYRPGDATANPYLFLSAMLLSGIDGVFKNMSPEKFNFGPFDGGVPDTKVFKNKIKMLPADLSEALDCLEKDHEYLLYQNVFDETLVRQWLKIKRAEIEEISGIPHPKEFELYFNF